ncbi:phosphosulfolactate synthase [Paenibacillus sp. sptzw28]|nr:phosphosulfolactate synthase [Paenibacillus sp. sptzw28]
MVIDKGLGRNAFSDLIETSGDYIDMIKLGFGTAPLYPLELLVSKIELAKRRNIIMMPGGTLLETAVKQNVVPAFFDTVCRLGFNGIEVSDGTIELPRNRRTELIKEGVRRGLCVVTEYGKKLTGSLIDASALAVTAETDLNAGAELIIVEARESGVGVGLFDENGECRNNVLETVCQTLGSTTPIMWEAPLKQQQVHLLKTFGPQVHLGNIPPDETTALETMRRGLRSDTFSFGLGKASVHYVI